MVEVTATDGNNETAVQTIRVSVRDLSEPAPVLTGPSGGAGAASSAISVNENQTAVTALAVDNAVTWVITGGADAGEFRINPATGEISFVTAPDFEAPSDANGDNVYLVEITATDSNNLSAVLTVAITVEDLDDSEPQITGPDGAVGATSSLIMLEEGATLVTTMQASEPVIWSLSGGSDQDHFVMDDSTGELSFVSAPSYETPTDSDKNNTYVVVVRATDVAANISDHTLTVQITDVDEVAPRIAIIAKELKSDLRGYAFKSLGDMLAFNEGLFRDTGDCMASAAQGTVTPGMHLNEFSQGTSLDWAKTHCTARYRVIANVRASIDHADGDWTRRGLASVRIENEWRQDLTFGLGLMGSFANNDLPSFADSSIRDHSLQINGYVKTKLAENLRAGAFVGFGRAWYDFDLHQTGFDLSGKMVGHRQVYGAMLSGDVEIRSFLVTTDLILSRATEDLGQATLVGMVDDDVRQVMFEVGGVDMTRISIPVSGELHIWGSDPKGWQSTLRLSPGLLC